MKRFGYQFTEGRQWRLVSGVIVRHDVVWRPEKALKGESDFPANFSLFPVAPITL
jgi:hypothetical protein